MKNTGAIEFYTADDGQMHLDVKMQDETVWLSQEQMATLFDKDRNTVIEHIGNIYKEQELDQSSTARKFRVVQKEGSREVNRQINHYNLDVIISVGYRVKSKRGTQFRIWAMNVLKDYLRKGYVVHTRLLEQQGTDVKSLLSLLETAVTANALASPEATEMIKIIKIYASSFSLLQQYDEDGISEPEGTKSSIQLRIDDASQAVAALKRELMSKGEATELFAQERGDAFAAIIGNIEQTFGGEALYPTVESRAAHLLYFMVKDHPFSDGNKRSAAFMFLLYLSQNNLLLKNGRRTINESGLVALTLLIAESDPAQKALMTKLVQNLIQ